MSLKPTPPHDALNRYIKDKQHELASKTIRNYRTSIGRFCDWLTDNGVSVLTDLDSEILQRYKEARLDEVKPITARNDLMTIKQFIRFCEHIVAVPREMSEMVRIPSVSKADEICEDILTKEEADAILDYLGKYNYASKRHVIILVLWKTGMRMSGLRALDLDNFDTGRPALELRHRPYEETPLKNGEGGERDVYITDEVTETLTDYIEMNRNDVVDEYGRNPLVTTKNGRIADATIQKYVYCMTRPCIYNGGNCPFDRDPEKCEAMSWGTASKCPGSVSPHALRRGYVTAARNAGQPKDVTGNRVNMTGDVLEKHYDHGTHNQKADRRKSYLKDI